MTKFSFTRPFSALSASLIFKPIGIYKTALDIKPMGLHHSHRDTKSRVVKPGKDPSEPINNSLIYRILLPHAAKILRRWRTPLAPRVLALTPNHILKYGYGTRLSEAHAMEYISKNTSVPVPRIISCFQSKGGNPYILMTRCPGIPLCNVFRELSADKKKDVLVQLRGFMDELRALTPPKPGWVGSTDYMSIDDGRIHSLPCGPFENVRDFHSFIRDGVERPSGIDELDQMISMQDSRDYQINFTHGDLSFRNILYHRGFPIIRVPTGGFPVDNT